MTDLGNLVRQHQGSPWRALAPAGISFLFTVGGIYAIAAMDPPSPGKAALVVALFAAIGVGFLWLALRDAATRLELRERGLVYTRNGRPRSVRYADIRAAVERRFNGKPNQLILELHSGGTFEIQTALVDYDAAAQAIARSI